MTPCTPITTIRKKEKKSHVETGGRDAHSKLRRKTYCTPMPSLVTEHILKPLFLPFKCTENAFAFISGTEIWNLKHYRF
jgi:hypothetical protein